MGLLKTYNSTLANLTEASTPSCNSQIDPQANNALKTFIPAFYIPEPKFFIPSKNFEKIEINDLKLALQNEKLEQHADLKVFIEGYLDASKIKKIFNCINQSLHKVLPAFVLNNFITSFFTQLYHYINIVGFIKLPLSTIGTDRLALLTRSNQLEERKENYKERLNNYLIVVINGINSNSFFNPDEFAQEKAYLESEKIRIKKEEYRIQVAYFKYLLKVAKYFVSNLTYIISFAPFKSLIDIGLIISKSAGLVEALDTGLAFLALGEIKGKEKIYEDFEGKFREAHEQPALEKEKRMRYIKSESPQINAEELENCEWREILAHFESFQAEEDVRLSALIEQSRSLVEKRQAEKDKKVLHLGMQPGIQDKLRTHFIKMNQARNESIEKEQAEKNAKVREFEAKPGIQDEIKDFFIERNRPNGLSEEELNDFISEERLMEWLEQQSASSLLHLYVDQLAVPKSMVKNTLNQLIGERIEVEQFLELKESQPRSEEELINWFEQQSPISLLNLYVDQQSAIEAATLSSFNQMIDKKLELEKKFVGLQGSQTRSFFWHSALTLGVAVGGGIISLAIAPVGMTGILTGLTVASIILSLSFGITSYMMGSKYKSHSSGWLNLKIMIMNIRYEISNYWLKVQEKELLIKNSSASSIIESEKVTTNNLEGITEQEIVSFFNQRTKTQNLLKKLENLKEQRRNNEWVDFENYMWRDEGNGDHYNLIAGLKEGLNLLDFDLINVESRHTLEFGIGLALTETLKELKSDQPEIQQNALEIVEKDLLTLFNLSDEDYSSFMDYQIQRWQ